LYGKCLERVIVDRVGMLLAGEKLQGVAFEVLEAELDRVEVLVAEELVGEVFEDKLVVEAD